jgi:hypothetical protein
MSEHPEKSTFKLTVLPMVGISTSKFSMNSIVEFGTVGASIEVSKVVEGTGVEKPYTSGVTKSREVTMVQLVGNEYTAEKLFMELWFSAVKKGMPGARAQGVTLIEYNADNKTVARTLVFFDFFPSGWEDEARNKGEAGKQRITWTMQYTSCESI